MFLYHLQFELFSTSPSAPTEPTSHSSASLAEFQDSLSEFLPCSNHCDLFDCQESSERSLCGRVGRIVVEEPCFSQGGEVDQIADRNQLKESAASILVDREEMAPTSANSLESGARREREASQCSSHSGSNSSRKLKATKIKPTIGKFVSTLFNGSNASLPRIGLQKAEFNMGILHLYRDPTELSPGAVTELEHQQHSSDKKRSPVDEHPFPSSDLARTGLHNGTVLCILGVPSYMTTQDFLLFINTMRDNIAHLRLLRDSNPGRYMVLLKFNTFESGWEFYTAFNGQAFNSFEREYCHVVYIKSIQFKSAAIPPHAFPPIMDDPSLPVFSSSSASGGGSTTANTSGPAGNANKSISPPPNRDLTSPVELPTCPVCLERLDSSVTGLLTTFCHHTYHCDCLMKWAETSCPVCRYSNISTSDPADDLEENNECMDCGTTHNLWICLICGNIGCGRYQGMHAYQHFVATNHLYALELETQRVWDYVGDGYVHRLIQNKADGKLVELPGDDVGGILSGNCGLPDAVTQEKLDAIGLEYTYLLTSQLESQRIYYEQQMEALQDAFEGQLAETIQRLSALECRHQHSNSHYEVDRGTANRQFDEQQMQSKSSYTQHDECLVHPKSTMAIQTDSMEEDTNMTSLLTQRERKIEELKKEKKSLEKKWRDTLSQVVTLQKQLSEDQALTKSLLTNQSEWKKQLEQKNIELEDLKEQVRDLMFFIEAQQKIEKSELKEEIEGGTLVVQQEESKKKGKSKIRKKG